MRDIFERAMIISRSMPLTSRTAKPICCSLVVSEKHGVTCRVEKLWPSVVTTEKNSIVALVLILLPESASIPATLSINPDAVYTHKQQKRIRIMASQSTTFGS